MSMVLGNQSKDKSQRGRKINHGTNVGNQANRQKYRQIDS